MAGDSREDISVILEKEHSQNVKYFEHGVAEIAHLSNPGYAGAFPNHEINTNGILLNKGDFLKLLKNYKIDSYIKHFPDNFHVTIKYSPIALFKKWIFTFSDLRLLKVSDRKKGYTHEFFFLIIGTHLFFVPMITNVAHENFLLSLYEKTHCEQQFTARFNTYFSKEKKLALYKDYIKNKTTGVTLTQADIHPGALYPVRIDVFRDTRGIKFRVQVNNNRHTVTHAIKLSRGGKRREAASSKIQTRMLKNAEDYRKEVFDLCKTFDQVTRSTNKFANIALGRINKIPVLVNLPAKYCNRPVKITISRNKEIIVFDEKNLLLKCFVISGNPKSNWLEKK